MNKEIQRYFLETIIVLKIVRDHPVPSRKTMFQPTPNVNIFCQLKFRNFGYYTPKLKLKVSSFNVISSESGKLCSYRFSILRFYRGFYHPFTESFVWGGRQATV